MMHDQASSLRQLKKLRDSEAQESLPGKKEFLEGLPRPTRFPAIALIVPDHLDGEIPPLQAWVSCLAESSGRTCLWDQAGLQSGLTSLPSGDHIFDHAFPTLTTIETDGGPFLILPRITEFSLLTQRPETNRLKFARNLFRTIGSVSELWITLRASELPNSQAILHATDLACILVPDHPDAVLRSYEAVKSIRLSGYFGNFGLIPLNHEGAGQRHDTVERVKSVAKQFLSLDLLHTGVVLLGQGNELSGKVSVKSSVNPILRGAVGAINMKSADFQFLLTERLLFPVPGDVR